MTPITVRQGLNEYEFTDEQEMTLTLELLNRIEKETEIAEDAKEADEKIADLRTKLTKENRS